MTVTDRTELGESLAAGIIDGPGGYTGVEGDARWAAEIRRLATVRGATILAHNYQIPAIQDVADHHLGALLNQHLGAGSTHAARVRPPGDQCNFVFDSSVVCASHGASGY